MKIKIRKPYLAGYVRPGQKSRAFISILSKPKLLVTGKRAYIYIGCIKITL